MKKTTKKHCYRVMVFGVGAFAHGVCKTLKSSGADVSVYLTRDHAHYGPSVECRVFSKNRYPNPCELLTQNKIDYVVPMSLDWALQSWNKEFLKLNIPILCARGTGYMMERERDFSRKICEKYGVRFARSYFARDRRQAEKFIDREERAYVIKNPFCRPGSPINTVVGETVDQTRSLLRNIDFREGAFLQQYLGMKEAGHIAFISGGNIYSLVSNQEFKRPHNSDQGIIAWAPIAGLVEQDSADRYGLARELLHPLLPWFRETGFNGPIQVTALKSQGKWFAVEYNIRLGVTSGPLILKMLKNPADVMARVSMNKELSLDFRKSEKVGASITLAGYGYPYSEIIVPKFPVEVRGKFNSDCDILWNDVDLDSRGKIFTSGLRIADAIATGMNFEQAIAKVYHNIKKITCYGSYYRTDIGKTSWRLRSLK